MHHRPCVCMFSHVPLFVAPWTIALHAPLSMDFSRQEYWSRLSFPAPGIFPAQRSNLHLLHPLCWQEDSLPLRHLGSHCRLWVERKFVGISQEIQWLKLHASITGGQGFFRPVRRRPWATRKRRVYRKNRNKMECMQGLESNFILCYEHFTFIHRSS